MPPLLLREKQPNKQPLDHEFTATFLNQLV